MSEERDVDYKALYLRMVRSAEKAISILTGAQQECEEIYIRGGEQGRVIHLHENNED